jgi:hypothetical protein
MLSLLLLVVLFLALVCMASNLVITCRWADPILGNGACLTAAQDKDIARACVEGNQVSPDLLAFLVLYGIGSVLWRVDEL